MDRELSVNVRGNFAQLSVRHGFVSFVFEIQRALAFEIVAHEAVEDHSGAIFNGFEVEQNFARFDEFAHQKNDVAADSGLLATADGREESDLVTGRERGAPFGVFLIHRCGDRRAKVGEARKAARVTLVDVFDAGAFGELGFLLRDAGDVLELAEK